MNEPRPGRTTAYDAFRRLLTPDQVRDLSRLRPGRAVLHTAAHWSVILLAWAAAAYWRSALAVSLAIPAIGIAYYGLFIIGHDGLHRRILPGRRANDLFNDLLILGPIAAITRINNINHLSHHDHLATDQDPDRHKYGCFNKWEPGRLVAYLSGLGTLLTSARHVYFPADAPSAPHRPRYHLRDLAILIGWQGALIAGLTRALGPWGYPLLWAFPVFGFTFLMDNLRTFAEHSQPEADAVADAHRLISYVSSVPERIVIAPMWMNLHAIHHLWPSIPYYNLPAAARLVRALPDQGGLEWRRSYLGYLWRYWRALPLTECRAPAPSA